MKNKLLYYLIGIFVVVIGIAAGASIFSLYQPKVPLFSPLINKISTPNLTAQLRKKIVSPPKLNYTTVTPTDLPSHLSYLAYNSSTSKVYAASGHTKRISPASFTKLMTVQVALDIATSNQLLTVSQDATDKEPTILGLKAGEQLPLLELIRASIATSANDAAAVIAQGSAGTYGQDTSFFIDLMNQKAQILNMKNTRFINPEGYDDDNQYSTLEDLATLVKNAQTYYPEIIAAGESDREDIEASTTNGFYYLSNWNGLLSIYPGVTGLKIAYTENAGFSTIITASRENIPITVILTGAVSLEERDLMAAQLLDHAYKQENITTINLAKSDLAPRYKIWTDLIEKTKAELKKLDSTQ